MTTPEIITFVIGAAITIIVGGYFGGAKARAEIKKLAAEREKTDQESLNQRVEREQKLNEIIERQDRKIESLEAARDSDSKKIEALEADQKRTSLLIVTLEKQLIEREELLEDFRDYVGKLVIIMKAARLNVPEFQPRKGYNR